jgi:hypothetical protein
VIGTKPMIQSAQQLGVSEPRLHLASELFPTHTLVTGFAVAGHTMTNKVVGGNNHTCRSCHSHFRTCAYPSFDLTDFSSRTARRCRTALGIPSAGMPPKPKMNPCCAAEPK